MLNNSLLVVCLSIPKTSVIDQRRLCVDWPLAAVDDSLLSANE